MIIDCHGHYTTEPPKMKEWRENQLKAVEDGDFKPTRALLEIHDDDIREGIEGNQRKLQQERGTDLTVFSPRAVGMGHHLGTAETSMEWTQLSNDMIRRVCDLYRRASCRFAPCPSIRASNPRTAFRNWSGVSTRWDLSAAT